MKNSDYTITKKLSLFLLSFENIEGNLKFSIYIAHVLKAKNTTANQRNHLVLTSGSIADQFSCGVIRAAAASERDVTALLSLLLSSNNLLLSVSSVPTSSFSHSCCHIQRVIIYILKKPIDEREQAQLP